MQFLSLIKEFNVRYEQEIRGGYDYVEGQFRKNLVLIAGLLFWIHELAELSYQFSEYRIWVGGALMNIPDMAFLFLLSVVTSHIAITRMIKVQEWLKPRAPSWVAYVCGFAAACLLFFLAAATVFPVVFEIYFSTALAL